MVKITHVGLTATLLLTAASATLAGDFSEEQVAAEVKRLRDSDENAWKRIPWVATLTQARNASRSEQRPLFFFSYEGNLETGRC